MGTKNATSTATNKPPSWITDAYKGLFKDSTKLADKGYKPYTGGFTPDQTAAFQNIRGLYGASNDNFGAANSAFNAGQSAFAGAMTPSYERVNDYMNPYVQNVINATMANMQETNARQQQDVLGNLASRGALGGNRVGVAQAELARQQGLANNQTIAGLWNDAYSQALGAAQQQQGFELQGGQGLTGIGQAQANLGSTAMQTNLAQAAAQLGGGTQQQQFDYQQYLNKLGFPYQQQSWLAGILSGSPGAGGTTTNVTPQGNIFSQLLGAGLGIASLFKDGGVVRPRYADGGVMPYVNDNADYPAALLDLLPYAAMDGTPFINYLPQGENNSAHVDWPDPIRPAEYADGGVVSLMTRGRPQSTNIEDRRPKTNWIDRLIESLLNDNDNDVYMPPPRRRQVNSPFGMPDDYDPMVPVRDEGAVGTGTFAAHARGGVVGYAKGGKVELSAEDKDILARTLLGEALGEGTKGMEAVAHVIKNRSESGQYPSNPVDVVMQPGQFSTHNEETGYNKGRGGNRLDLIGGGKDYDRALAVVDSVFGGTSQDPTQGSLNYWAPSGMKGGADPSWARGKDNRITIGNHVFLTGGGSGGGNTRSLQQQLADRGFSPGPIDGIRGPQTKAAIKAFQQANGLVVDGIAGPKTMAALNAQPGMQLPSDAMYGVSPLGLGAMRADAAGLVDGRPAWDGRFPDDGGVVGDGRLMGMGLPQQARFDDIGAGPSYPELRRNMPLPFPGPLVPPNGGLISRPVQTYAVDMDGNPIIPANTAPTALASTAPVPMPGRPAALNAGVVAPAAANNNGSVVASPTPTPAADLVRLPSGKMAKVGTYTNPNTGNLITVSRGPDGMGKVEIARSGLINIGREMNAPTIAGGIIRSKIAEATPQMLEQGVSAVTNNLAPVVDNVKNSANDAINNVAPIVSNLGNQISGLFGFFGGGNSAPGTGGVVGPTGSAFTGGWGSPAPQPGSAFTGGWGSPRSIVAPSPMPSRPFFSMVAPTPMPGRPAEIAHNYAPVTSAGERTTITGDDMAFMPKSVQTSERWNTGYAEGGVVGRRGYAPGGIIGGNGYVPYTVGDQFVTEPTSGYSSNIGDVFQSLGAGNGLNLSPDFRQALLSAGAGMMSSKSPFALAGVGEGVQQGVQTWNERQALERENALARSNIANQSRQTDISQQLASAQVPLMQAQTAAARYVTRPTMVGMQVFDLFNPDEVKIVPWGGKLPNGQIATQPAPDTGGGSFEPIFDTTPPPPASPVGDDPRLQMPEAGTYILGETERVMQDLRGKQQSATAANQQLQEMRHQFDQLPESGWFAPGSGFEQRASLAKAVDTAFKMAGIDSPVLESELAAAQDVQKISFRLQGELARNYGSNAASIIMDAASSVPSGFNSREGFNVIVNGLEAMNRRNIDYYNFVNEWLKDPRRGGSTLGADVAFNKMNPPELYALSTYVPGEDMQDLINDPSPSRIAAFNHAYGGDTGRDVAQYVLQAAAARQ